MKKLTALLILLFSSSYADLTDEFNFCRDINDNKSRLECFDKIGSEKETIQTKSKWVLHTDVSKIDDSKRVILHVISSDEIEGVLGNNTNPVLLLRCQENKTEVFVNTDVFLGIGEISVTSRIDKQKAVTTKALTSSDNKAFFISKPISFIKNLMAGERVLFKLTPYNSSPIIFEFNIAGLESEIKPLREACNW